MRISIAAIWSFRRGTAAQDSMGASSWTLTSSQGGMRPETHHCCLAPRVPRRMTDSGDEMRIEDAINPEYDLADARRKGERQRGDQIAIREAVSIAGLDSRGRWKPTLGCLFPSNVGGCSTTRTSHISQTPASFTVGTCTSRFTYLGAKHLYPPDKHRCVTGIPESRGYAVMAFIDSRLLSGQRWAVLKDRAAKGNHRYERDRRRCWLAPDRCHSNQWGRVDLRSGESQPARNE